MATPGRQWPPRLRRALRDRLASKGLRVPAGLVIQYGPRRGQGDDRKPWITVMHRPGPSESCSVHDMHIPFLGQPDIAAVTDMAERHAMAMLRRDARDAALAAGGHQMRRPPVHMTEARPLVALALALVEAGLGGIDGGATVDNGEMQFNGVTLRTPSGEIEFMRGRRIWVTSREEWPATVLMALRGRPLSDAIALPACGRADIDDAVSRLVIEDVQHIPGGIAIAVEPARLVPCVARDEGDDRSWLPMEPVPVT